VTVWFNAGVGIPGFEQPWSLAEFEGTVIGLANVRRIIEPHGGQA